MLSGIYLYIDKYNYETLYRSLTLSSSLVETPFVAKKNFSRVSRYTGDSHPFDRFLDYRHFSHSRALGAICCAEFAYISY